MVFEEQARQSRLTTDLDSVVETAGSAGEMEKGEAHANIGVTRRKYRLRDGRAVLKITAQVGTAEAGGKEKGGKEHGDKEDEGGNSPVITTIVTGPSERVFLSANAAFTTIRQTKYNVSDQTFEHGNKPTELLIGVNYSMHDVFQKRQLHGPACIREGTVFWIPGGAVKAAIQSDSWSRRVQVSLRKGRLHYGSGAGARQCPWLDSGNTTVAAAASGSRCQVFMRS